MKNSAKYVKKSYIDFGSRRRSGRKAAINELEPFEKDFTLTYLLNIEKSKEYKLKKVEIDETWNNILEHDILDLFRSYLVDFTIGIVEDCGFERSTLSLAIQLIDKVIQNGPNFFFKPHMCYEKLMEIDFEECSDSESLVVDETDYHYIDDTICVNKSCKYMAKKLVSIAPYPAIVGSCIFMAAKYEETRTPHLLTVVKSVLQDRIYGCVFAIDDKFVENYVASLLLYYENHLWKSRFVNYYIDSTTTSSFISALSNSLRLNQEANALAFFFSEITYYDIYFSFQYRSTTAIVCCMLAIHIMALDIDLNRYLQLNEIMLDNCKELLDRLLFLLKLHFSEKYSVSIDSCIVNKINKLFWKETEFFNFAKQGTLFYREMPIYSMHLRPRWAKKKSYFFGKRSWTKIYSMNSVAS